MEDKVIKKYKPVLKKLIHIGEYSPSQWEGETEDGLNVYIRFRFGRLTVNIGRTDGNDEWKELMCMNLHGKGSEWEGEMETERMLDFLKEVMDISKFEFIPMEFYDN